MTRHLRSVSFSCCGGTRRWHGSPRFRLGQASRWIKFAQRRISECLEHASCQRTDGTECAHAAWLSPTPGRRGASLSAATSPRGCARATARSCWVFRPRTLHPPSVARGLRVSLSSSSTTPHAEGTTDEFRKNLPSNLRHSQECRCNPNRRHTSRPHALEAPPTG